MVNGEWWMAKSAGTGARELLRGKLVGLATQPPHKRRLFPNWAGDKGETSRAPFQDSES